MIIDFHTHVFPDAIAQKTIDFLASQSGFVPYGNGTLSQLLALMEKGNVNHSVILPVVTKPAQFQSINRFAAQLSQRPEIYAFGGIHPDDETPEAHLDEIKSLGLLGIKIHPDYQGVFIDDPRYIRIIRYALSIGLPVITHAGVDDGIDGETKCTPDRILRMLHEVYGDNFPENPQIILAHAGSHRMYDEVLDKLCGLPVYFDLAYIMEETDPAVVLSIIRKHGADKILFATDSPWGDPRKGIDYLRSLPLTDDELEAILSRNALRILCK